MRTVLLDRADRQAQNRGFPEIPGNLRKGQITDRAWRWRASQGRSSQSYARRRRSRRTFIKRRLVLAEYGHQMIEFVSGAGRLGGEIAAVVGIDRALQGN